MASEFEQLATPGSLRLIDRCIDSETKLTSTQRTFLFETILARAHKLCTYETYEEPSAGSLPTTFHKSVPRTYTTQQGNSELLYLYRSERQTSLDDPTIHETVGLGRKLSDEDTIAWGPIVSLSLQCLKTGDERDASSSGNRFNLAQDAADLLLAVGLF